MLNLKQQFITDGNGKQVNVVLTKKDYDRLIGYIEDLEDIAAYDRAKKEKGAPISWEKIRR